MDTLIIASSFIRPEGVWSIIERYSIETIQTQRVTPSENGTLARPVTEPAGIQETAVMDESMCIACASDVASDDNGVMVYREARNCRQPPGDTLGCSPRRRAEVRPTSRVESEYHRGMTTHVPTACSV